MAGLGWQELVIVLVIIMIIFGAGKLPDVVKSLGQGVKEFKAEAATPTVWLRPRRRVQQTRLTPWLQPPSARGSARTRSRSSRGFAGSTITTTSGASPPRSFCCSPPVQ